MRPLSAQELIEIRERGEHQQPVDRALMVLVATCPEKDVKELAGLSIGQRDALLLALYGLTFGPQLEAFCECPACDAQLEFSINTAALLANNTIPADSALHLEAGGFNIRFRLPTSIDLAASMNLDIAEGYKMLLRKCVIEASKDNKKIKLEALPETVTSALAAQMLECDPLAEVQLDLACPACDHRWPMLLDIVSFLWAELDWQAKYLLRQVHILARAYGWRQDDILSMSAWRRQRYLDMVMSWPIF